MQIKKDIKIKILIKDRSGKNYTIKDLFPFINLDQFNFKYVDDPDFIIYTQSGNSEFLNYKCVRISIDAERYTPDFNLCDYAISDDRMQFEDRHCRIPYLANSSFRNDINELRNREKYTKITNEILNSKDIFCNFIYSNDMADKIRFTLFNKLSEYKKVHSGGRLLNNIGFQIGGGIDDYQEKIEFQSMCKFTLAIENVKARGHTTEKILHGFMAKTVPIYWGNPLVEEFFNPKAFINCNQFENLDDMLQTIINLDNDNELYIRMLNEPILNPSFIPEKYDLELSKFFTNIFIQEKEFAKRRSFGLHSALHESDFRKGRRLREFKRQIEYSAIKLFEKYGIRDSTFYHWYKNKFYYK